MTKLCESLVVTSTTKYDDGQVWLTLTLCVSLAWSEFSDVTQIKI